MNASLTSSRRARPLSPETEARRLKSREDAARDAELVAQARAGREAAFAEIVSHHREKLLSVAQSYLRDHHDAEEVVQDTFIRAYRGLAHFRGDCSLLTWLHRITINLARNRYWYFHRRSRHTTCSIDRPLCDDGAATMADVLPSDEALPSRNAVTTEFTELVTACMVQLDPSQCEILTLRNILNHSYAEIAAELGIEEGTVKSRIARARGNLRNLMAAACKEFDPNAAPAEWLDLAPPVGANA